MKQKAFTLIEIIIAVSLFIVLIMGAYGMFSSEVKSLKSALEHIGVNESARRLFAQMGNDIRNSNWVDFPLQIDRKAVNALSALSEGKVLALKRQVFDFSVKPPDSKLIREEKIEYYLKKSDKGYSSLVRKISGETGVGSAAKNAERTICDGIYNMLVFTTGRRPIAIESGSSLLPLKASIHYEPYEADGTGPYLIHIKTSFVKTNSKKSTEKAPAFSVYTSFALRGRLNAIHP